MADNRHRGEGKHTRKGSRRRRSQRRPQLPSEESYYEYEDYPEDEAYDFREDEYHDYRTPEEVRMDNEYFQNRRRQARRRREDMMRRRKNRIVRIIVAALLVVIVAAAFLHDRGSGENGHTSDVAAGSQNTVSTQEPVRTEAEAKTDTSEASSEAGTKETGSSTEAAADSRDDETASFKKGYTFAASPNISAVSDDVESKYAILVNLDSGQIVAGKEYMTKMYPASMTKMLTVLVAAENIDMSKLDTDTFTITQDITDYVYKTGSSAVNYEVGDTPTVRDLFYGTILPSGADAAMALAEYTAGSEEKFVQMMNDKLEELGISDTCHFTNPVGTYDDNHYATAYDMAVIMKAALENDFVREVMSAHTYTTTGTKQNPEGYLLSNLFLRRIEDRDTHGTVRCAKTGFVNEAGCCAASYQISNDGQHWICITGNAWSSWQAIYDHVNIYDAFTS